MVRIDCLLFGYRKMSVKPEDAAKASAILLRGGIGTDIDYTGSFAVRERDYTKASSLLARQRIEFSSSNCLGLRGYIRNSKKHPAVLVALALALLLNVFLSTLVWDIRISGNNIISDGEVAEALADSGLRVGSLWLGKDISEIEAKTLGGLDDAAWISVNRRGTVAYVEIIERQGEDRPTPPVGYSNLVARCDCVIEEITVRSGVAVVKPGDTVRAGELLISGVLPAESGGGYCYASGTVRGSVSDSIEVVISPTEEREEYITVGLDEVGLNIFGISLKIFKKYGNDDYGCDIIENEKVYSLFGKYRLPVSLTRKYRARRESTTLEYTPDEMVALATLRMGEELSERLAEAELSKIRTVGEFADGKYQMTSYLVFTEDVGRDLPFSAEEK